jgi:hypothetical protein
MCDIGGERVKIKFPCYKSILLCSHSRVVNKTWISIFSIGNKYMCRSTDTDVLKPYVEGKTGESQGKVSPF